MQNNIINKDSLFILLGALFLAEQIIYYFMMAYPYRYGIRLHTLNVSNLDARSNKQITTKKIPLIIKTINNSSEIYLRHKYPPLVAGPLLFVAEIKTEPEHIAVVRIGYATALFILYLMLGFLLEEGFYGLMNTIWVAGLVVWFYLQLRVNFQKWIETKNE